MTVGFDCLRTGESEDKGGVSAVTISRRAKTYKLTVPLRAADKLRRMSQGGQLAGRWPNLFALIVALLACVLPGCVTETKTQGVQNLWRGESAPVFRRGQSTQQDVLAALGPPSQLISLGDQTVFYYLLEQTRSHSEVLIAYNQTHAIVVYDRAVFFFDAKGRLTEFATSHERITENDK